MDLLKLREYAIWFGVNFIMCLTPFLVMIALDHSSSQIFSGFLAYNFTLLISSLYLLLTLLSAKRGDKTIPVGLLLGTIFWIILILIVLVLYPNIPSQPIANCFSSDHDIRNSIIIVAITIILSYFLNRHSLEDNIEQLRVHRKREAAKRISSKVETMKHQLANGD